MKKHDQMTDRELLIRIDERTSNLPSLTKRVQRHEVSIAVLSVLVFILVAKTMPFIAEALAKAIQ